MTGPLQLCESRAREMGCVYYAHWAARIRNMASVLRGLAMNVVDAVCLLEDECKMDRARERLVGLRVGRTCTRTPPVRGEAFVVELYEELVGFGEVFVALTERWLVICDDSRI